MTREETIIFDSKHINRFKRRRRWKIKKSTVAILAIILITIVALILVILLPKNTNHLLGAWRYDKYTKYIFKEDGTGSLNVDDVIYNYKYEISADKLTLDFSDDIIKDCDYTFLVDGEELTLIGGKNTDGGTYKLQKKQQ